MKIVFMGTPDAAVPTLERILDDGHEIVAVWTQPDRPSGRGGKLKASPVKQFALEKDLEIFQPVKIRTRKSIDIFKSHDAEVAVVVAYGRILSKSYLSAFPKGCINVHFSLLPKYRGAAPVNWAIVNGETKTGITTMKMDAGLDTGDVLLQCETLIGEAENSIELMERLSLDGAELLAKTLTDFDDIEPTPQKHQESTLAPLMFKEDGEIDWSLSASAINNRVRGFQPFPRSFTIYKGQKLTLWKAEESQIADFKFQSLDVGKILLAKGNDLFISCGKGTVLNIDELQIQGKRRMGTRDFLNGIKLEVGEVLG